MIGLMPNTAAGPSNDLTVTLVDSATLGVTLNQYTIPNVALGAVTADREIFVVISLHNNTGPSLASGTIAGITAQVVTGRYGIMWAPVPTGTSGTITFSVGQTCGSGSIAVFSVSKRRIPNAAPISSPVLGTSFTTSFSINNNYPINAVGMFAAFVMAQSGSTSPNTTINAPYTKVARDTVSGGENFTGYLLPKTTFSGDRAFAGTFGMTAALGGKLFIIE